MRRAGIDLDRVGGAGRLHLGGEPGDIRHRDRTVGRAVQHQNRRFVAVPALALGGVQTAVETGVARGHPGHVAARHLQRDGAAETVAHHHHAAVTGPRQRRVGPGLQQRAHPRPVAVKRAGGGAAMVHRLGRRRVAEHVEREGVVAHFGQHVGAPAFVIRHPVPVVDDQHGAARAVGRGPVAGEGLSVDRVGDVFGKGGRRAKRGRGQKGCQAHGVSPWCRCGRRMGPRAHPPLGIWRATGGGQTGAGYPPSRRAAAICRSRSRKAAAAAASARNSARCRCA